MLYLAALRGATDVAALRQRLHIAMLAIFVRKGLQIVNDLRAPLQDDEIDEN